MLQSLIEYGEITVFGVDVGESPPSGNRRFTQYTSRVPPVRLHPQAGYE